jgi:hypothetical protein
MNVSYLWSLKKIRTAKFSRISKLQKVVSVSDENAQKLVKSVIGDDQAENHQNPGQVDRFEFQPEEKGNNHV